MTTGKRKWKQMLILSALLLGWSCSADAPEENSFEDCRYLAPEPIFSERLAGLRGHTFSLDGQSAEESFRLSNGLQVTIEQSGCDFIRQVFTFEWESGPRGNSAVYWSRAAQDKFRQLARLGAPYLSFKAISDAVADMERQIAMGEQFQLQPGLTMEIRPLSEAQPQRLQVVLQQTEAG